MKTALRERLSSHLGHALYGRGLRNPDVGDTAFALATHIWRARDYQGNGPWRDSKAGAIAQKGALGQAGITADGLWLPGLATDYPSTPDAPTLDVVGDIDLRAFVVDSEWGSAAGIETFIDKMVHPNRSYTLDKAVGGALRLIWSADGAAQIVATSTAAPPFTTGSPGYVRVTLDVDNGASGYDVTFYTSTDGVTWTQLGAVVTGGATTSIFAGTARLAFGQTEAAGSNRFTGTVGWFEVRDGIDGTLVASPNFAAATPGALTVTDDQGNVWTVNQSADGSDDPLDLDHAGTKHVRLPGSADNYVSTPDSVANSITGDLDLRCRVSADDWSLAANQGLISKYLTTGNQRSFRWVITTSGGSTFYWSANGSTTVANATNTTTIFSLGYANGDEVEFRLTLDVDDGSGNSVVTWYHRAVGATTWTQWGTPFTHAATSSVFDGSATLDFGMGYNGTAEPFNGTVRWAEAYDGIDGTLVADFNVDRDFSDHNTLTSSTTSEVWTFNRSTAATGARLAVVTADTFLYDGGDFLKLDPLDSFDGDQAITVLIPFRCHDDTNLTFPRLWAHNTAGTDPALELFHTTTTISARLNDGTNNNTAHLTPVVFADGGVHVAILRYDPVAGTLAAMLDGSTAKQENSSLTVSTPISWDGQYVGAKGASNFVNHEIPAVLIAREALSDVQIDAICTHLIASHP